MKNILSDKKSAAWLVIAVLAVVVVVGAGLALNPPSNPQSGQWTPQPVIEDQDDYLAAFEAAQKSVRSEEITVADTGNHEKTAQQWMLAWFDMHKALPANNMAYITDGAVDDLQIAGIAKEGLPSAFFFAVNFSVRPTYPIGLNAYWVNPNAGPSPGRDETWGQMYRQIELRQGDDGRYHLVSMGTGGLSGDLLENYDLVPTNEDDE